MEEKQYAKAHKLLLSNRRTGTISGVTDVISFDIAEILLETEQGMLTIKGSRSPCEPSDPGEGRSRYRGTDRQYGLLRGHGFS